MRGGLKTMTGVVRNEGTGVGQERGWSWSCMTGEGQGGMEHCGGDTKRWDIQDYDDWRAS